jgi:hypothetical protein
MPSSIGFPKIANVNMIASRLGTEVGTGGHSRVVAIDGGEAWLAKLYRPGALRPGDETRLDRLIALPSQFDSADRDTAARATSWPVSRLVDGDATLGVLLPAAPPKFRAGLITISGQTTTRLLAIDWLAQPDQRHARRGLPALTWRDRLLVCRHIVAVAELLERHGLVYGDWNYGNAFWSFEDHSAYVIDIDSCSFGPQRLVSTPNWEDPLSVAIADAYTDRYRVALLVGRCLTGQRSITAVGEALRSVTADVGAESLPRVIEAMLTTGHRSDRPSVVELLCALDHALDNAMDTSSSSVNGPIPSPADDPVVKRSTSNDDDANVSVWRPTGVRDQRVDVFNRSTEREP